MKKIQIRPQQLLEEQCKLSKCVIHVYQVCNLVNRNVVNPFPPVSANWHLYRLIITLSNPRRLIFTHQWGTPWAGKG